MTDPTQPPARGRHSDADSGAGRPAAELLAAWGTGESDTLQLAEETMRPRRRRRYAPDTEGSGLLAPRSAVDVADVEITGLEAPGIADAGLAAAGLDLSAFGIARPETPRRTTAAPKPWSWGAGAIVHSSPRTTEMPAARPPAVPHLDSDDRTGRRASDRRVPPAPRAAVEPTTADRVTADRFADADTDPGWLSAHGRVAPVAAAGSGPSSEQAEAAPAGSLAALFAELPTAASVPRPAAPVDEPVTEVHAALGTGELRRREAAVAASWQSLQDRHRTEESDDGEGAEPADLPLQYDDRYDERYDDRYDGYDDHRQASATVFDETGGLEVIVTGSEGPDDHDDLDHDDLDHDGGNGGGRGRRGGGRGGRGGGSGRRRKRRGPIVIALSLIVLAALVAGIGVGGLVLWRTINPIAKDYAGAGTGTVDIKVDEGDSLRTIAGTLVTAHVIASAKPFEDAAKANPAATGIQPGVYTLHQQMSGRSALDLLLDPASRQVTRVTIPEGMTAAQVLQRLADQAGMPLDQLKAAAADPAALGLPAYANGQLEGFLFPATYDVQPGDTPVAVLREMVAGTLRVLDDLQIPQDQRLGVLTEASIVQAEAGNVEDMGKVARVLDNRLADGMPLQLDTTVNYANGKSGVTTTSADRQNPSPYNTYMHPGLPPGAISNPGEEALRAVLNPTPGEWRFFVVVNPDTGETRFAVTAQEHSQNVLLFQQWLQEHPGN